VHHLSKGFSVASGCLRDKLG